MKTRDVLLAFPSILLVCASAAQASETVTYSYDALGRLTGSSSSGGPNSGVSTGTSFDPAGNRLGYSVSGSVALLKVPSRREAIALAATNIVAIEATTN